MKDRDYGYFGKGTTGYAQYRTAFKRNHNQNQLHSSNTTQPHSSTATPKNDEDKKENNNVSDGTYTFLIIGGLVLLCLILVGINQMLANL